MKYNSAINPTKCYWPKKEGSQPKWPNPKCNGICLYCVLDRPVFEWNQVLLHPELTPWCSFLFADGAHHKKPHSPTHPRCFETPSRSLWRHGNVQNLPWHHQARSGLINRGDNKAPSRQNDIDTLSTSLALCGRLPSQRTSDMECWCFQCH